MKHGELKEYIAPGTTKEDFLRRTQGAFNVSAPSPQPAQTTPSQSNTTAAQATPPAASSSSPDADPSDDVSRVLAERSARLRAKKEEAERNAAEQAANKQAKAKADVEAGVDSHDASMLKLREEVKLKRKKEAEERQRVLKRINDDKEARRVAAAERETRRKENQGVGDVAASLVKSPETKTPSTTRVGEFTAIQIRMLDGSSIRSRFKTASSISELRKWVDEKRTDGNQPYKFKQVLTPLPNRNIDDTEESKSLGDAGLAPSSTLVLIPINQFTAALDNDGPRTLIGTIMVGLFNLFKMIVAFFGLGGRAGSARAAPESTESQATTSGAATQAARARRVQGLENRDSQRDQQLYNGNSVSMNRHFLYRDSC